jgi:hypothetical protein
MLETKPAIYTTEFWVTLFGLALNFVNVADIWNWASNWHSGILATILIAFYTVARGIAKSKSPVDPNLASTYTLFPTLKKANPSVRR